MTFLAKYAIIDIIIIKGELIMIVNLPLIFWIIGWIAACLVIAVALIKKRKAKKVLIPIMIVFIVLFTAITAVRIYTSLSGSAKLASDTSYALIDSSDITTITDDNSSVYCIRHNGGTNEYPDSLVKNYVDLNDEKVKKVNVTVEKKIISRELEVLGGIILVEPHTQSITTSIILD